MLPWMSRGTIEYVASAVLGVSFGVLDPTIKHEHVEVIRDVM